jgi:hypothetical protein
MMESALDHDHESREAAGMAALATTRPIQFRPVNVTLPDTSANRAHRSATSMNPQKQRQMP